MIFTFIKHLSKRLCVNIAPRYNSPVAKFVDNKYLSAYLKVRHKLNITHARELAILMSIHDNLIFKAHTSRTTYWYYITYTAHIC